MNSSIGIIGGTDGPTAVFIARSPGAGLLLGAVILLLAAGILWVVLRRKKK